MARPNSRRTREAQREKALAATRAREAAARRRRRAVAGVVALVVLVSGIGAFVGATRSDSSSAPTTTTTTAGSLPAGADLPATGVTPPPAPVGAAMEGPTPCPAEDGSSPRTTHFAEPPPTCIDPAYFHVATITTTAGELTVQLNPARAPRTVNDFVVLARYHFYDGQPVTAVASRQSFTVGLAFEGEGADTAPGFAIPDEVPPQGQVFGAGTIAMVGTPGVPGTNRGQFLIATYEGAAGIDQGVTSFGQMLSGEDTLAAIDRLASRSGEPTGVVTVESITVERTSPVPR